MKTRPSPERHARTMTAHDLRRLRMRSQLLAEPASSGVSDSGAVAAPDRRAAGDPARAPADPTRAAETVRQLLAVQAQNLGGALWSIGQRAQGSTVADIEADVAAGVVVLTWPMRGTLHLVHADDADWLLPLLTPRAAVGREKLWRDAGLTDTVFDRAEAVLWEALADGPMSRPEVLRVLEAAGIGTKDQRASHLLRHLAERRVIIFGPRRGKTQTFMRYGDLVAAGGSDLSREEALRRLALRYMRGHGPATEHDLAWWSGLTLRDARAAVAMAAPDLAAVTVGERLYYLGHETLAGYESSALTSADPSHPGVAESLPRVHLLPGFDEFHIGYADRRLILAPEHQAVVGPGKNGLFRSPVVVDGVIAGTWSAAERKGKTDVEVVLFPSSSEFPPGRSEPENSDALTPGALTLDEFTLGELTLEEFTLGAENAASGYERFLGREVGIHVRRS